MKLRVHCGGANGAASLMLSPGDAAWCRIDAACVERDQAPASVVLTGMQRDQVSGLLDLRDGAPIDLYATPAVFEHLTLALPMLPVLQHYCGVQWHVIPVAGEQRSADFTIEHLPRLVFTALTSSDTATGERIALAVRDERTGTRLFVADGASLESAAADALFDWMADADCIVIDRAPHGSNTRWLERISQAAAPRKLLLGANGSDRSLLATGGIECVEGTAEFDC